MNIDIESNVVLDLANQYQGVNAQLTSMASNCTKPTVPNGLDVGGEIDSLMTTVTQAEDEISNKMKQVQGVLNRAIEILKANDEVNMLDFFSTDDLSYLMSGSKNEDGEIVALTFEERCSRMQAISDHLFTKLQEVKDIYHELYGNGIPYDAKKAYKMIKLFDALGVFVEDDPNSDLFIRNGIYLSVSSDFRSFHPNEDETVYLSKNTILDTFDWCEENNIIPVLKDYLSGKSWKDSGMEKLFGAKLRDIDAKMYDNHFEEITNGSLSDDQYAELIFMYRYLNETGGMADGKNDMLLIEDFENYVNSNNGSYSDIFDTNQENYLFRSGTRLKYYNIKDIDAARSYLKQFLSDSNLFETYEDLYAEALTCDTMEQDISIYAQMAYDYRFNGDAYAYEVDKNNPDYDYDKYFLHNYTNLKPFNFPSSYSFKNSTDIPYNYYEYLSQGEIAMYMMYLDNNELTKANDYIKSLQDRIISRVSMERVQTTLKRWNENGGDLGDYLDSGFQGFCSGMTSFTDGISALFTDGGRTANDYYNMYMLSYLSSDSELTNKLGAAYRETLKDHYEVMSSVGSSAIPVALSFIPGGRVASAIITTASSTGNKYKYARQNGADYLNAGSYCILSGLSDVAMMYLVSGIAGVNGSDSALNSFEGWCIGNVRSYGSAFMGTFIDAKLKSWGLGETFYLDDVTEQAGNNALLAARSTGIINATAAGIKWASSTKIGQTVIEKLTNIFYNPKFGLSVNINGPQVDLENPQTNTDIRMLRHLEGEVDKNGNVQGCHMVPSGVKLEQGKKCTWVTSYGDTVEYTPQNINGSGSEGYIRIKAKGSTTWTPRKYSSFFPQSYSLADIQAAINQTQISGSLVGSDIDPRREIMGSSYNHTWVRIIRDKTTGEPISVHTTFNKYAPKYSK